MRLFQFATVCMFALAFAAPIWAGPDEKKEEPAAEGGVKWEHDYKKGFEAAKTAKKPMFIDFMAEWCGPCKMLDKKVWPDAELAARIAKDFIAIKVDVDKDEATSKKYAISAMPTLIIADTDEKVLVRQVGASFSDPKGAMKWLDETMAALKDVAELEAKYQKDSKNLDTAIKLAETYIKLARHADAAKLLDEVLKALPKDDKRVLDVKQKLADCLLKGDIDAARGMELCKELTAAFLEAKDERAMDTVHGVMMGCWQKGEFKEAREALLKCVAAFPKHDKALEYRVYAAYLAAQADDKATAIKELKAIIEAGPADHEWVNVAKELLADLEGNG